MSRISRSVLSLVAAALSVAVVAAPAQAKAFHVTGTQTTITPSAKAKQFLSSHHINVTALGAATISTGSLTLPISGGFVAKSGNAGLLRHSGGVKFSGGSRSVALRHFVLVGTAHRGVLSARVAGRDIVLARLIDVTRTVSGKSGTISGELTLSRAAAHRINHLFGKHVVSAGADLGTLASSVTVV
jgi:hypothetical protein